MTDRGFLLDTMVVSELSKARSEPNVLRWLARQDSGKLFLSVVTIGEIERGIALKRKSEPASAARISAWLETVTAQFGPRILVVNQESAREWGRLATHRTAHDIDLLIAATAVVNDLTVATRNTRHFEPTGVKLFNPYLDTR